MLRKLSSKKLLISERRDNADFQSLFGEEAPVDVLQCLDDTDVGKKMVAEADKDDLWDVDRLDRSVGKDESATEIGGE